MTDIWFGTRGNRNASIMIVGEAWGIDEEVAKMPFVGWSGKELESMLRDAGVDINDCFFTNLIPDRPPANDFSFYFNPGRGTVHRLNPKPKLLTAMHNLYDQIEAIHPRLIIACGNYPLWWLTDGCATINKGVDKPKDGSPAKPDYPSGIGDYHGSQLWWRSVLYQIPVLPIYHPAALRDWTLRHTTVHDLRMRVPLALDNRWPSPTRNFFAPPPYSVVMDCLVKWSIATEPLALAVDIENASSPRHILTCIGFAWSANDAISIPFVTLTGKDQFESFWSLQQEKNILRTLNAMFKNPHVGIIGQNLVYDLQWFYHILRMRPRVVFDTLIAQNLLFPGTRKALGELSAMYCAHHRYWKDDNHDWASIGTLEQHLQYNCEDVVRTYEIATEQMDVLQRLDLAKHMPFELDKLALAREMNERGIRRDPIALADAGRRIIEQMTALGNTLSRLVKQEWVPTNAKKPTPWYRSDSQIKYVLYTLLGLPQQFDRKTKRPTTGKEALHALEEAYPRLRRLFTALADYGSLDTIYSTFIKGRAEPSGRIHASFNPAGTVTYRWSSSKNAFQRAHNMQNIPVGGEDE